MLIRTSHSPEAQLTKEAKQLITDAVFRAYKRHGNPPYAWETYWKQTKQQHFNLWIWLLMHYKHLSQELVIDKTLAWYFQMIENSANYRQIPTTLNIKNLGFNQIFLNLTPDNPNFTAITF